MALTADLIDNPSRYRLGMRLGPDRLDVTLYSPLSEGSLQVYSLMLDKASATPLKALEACVYDNPLLLSDFSSTACVIETPRFVILPRGLDAAADDEAISASEAIFTATFPDFVAENPVDTFLSPTGMPGVSIMAGVADEIVPFLRRTFFNVKLIHHLSPLCRYFLSMASRGNQSRLYANVRDGATDIVATRRGQLVAANTFITPTADDTAYFILAMRRGLGMGDEAEILLAGYQQLREAVTALLRPLTPGVMPVIFPSVMFRAGHDAMRAPFDLILLPLCE